MFKLCNVIVSQASLEQVYSKTNTKGVRVKINSIRQKNGIMALKLSLDVFI